MPKNYWQAGVMKNLIFARGRLAFRRYILPCCTQVFRCGESWVCLGLGVVAGQIRLALILALRPW